MFAFILCTFWYAQKHIFEIKAQCLTTGTTIQLLGLVIYACQGGNTKYDTVKLNILSNCITF